MRYRMTKRHFLNIYDRLTVASDSLTYFGCCRYRKSKCLTIVS